MSSLRSEKIADELRKEISLIINKETKDPRLQKINITAVKVSDDIGVANVFYTVIGESINIVESEINPKILKKFPLFFLWLWIMPSITFFGELSPPIASTAIFISSDM